MKQGFTLVEIMIVVAIIGLLATIAIPSFMRSRTTAHMNNCINNLRIIDAGKDQYAIEHGKTNLVFFGNGGVDNDAQAFSNLVGPANGYIKVFPLCPASTTVEANANNAANDYNVMCLGSNAQCVNVSDTHVLPTNE